jgi:hypothetical protein
LSDEIRPAHQNQTGSAAEDSQRPKTEFGFHFELFLQKETRQS